MSISGGQKPAVRIQANPTQLASYGLNLEDAPFAGLFSAGDRGGVGATREPGLLPLSPPQARTGRANTVGPLFFVCFRCGR